MTTPPVSTKLRSFLLPALWAASAFVILLAFMFCMLFIVPRFEKEALDQKVRLSIPMELTIAASRWHVKYWYVEAMVIMPICIGLGALVALMQPQGKLRTGCWVLWLVLFGIPALAMVSFVAWQILTLL